MCSYIDLVAGDSYIQVNRKLVKLVGLEAATYWAEILDIATKVVKKKTVDESGYWKIDRGYVEERTGIPLENQINCDAILHTLGVLDVNPMDPCKLGIKVEDYVKIIIDSDVKELELVKVKKTDKAKSKRDGQIAGMKNLLSEKDPELREYYTDWVDSVYAAKRFLTKVKIQLFEDTVNNYSTDKSVKLDILKQGIITGYDNAEWVINAYEKSGKSSGSHLTEQKVSTGISKNWEF